MFYFFIELRLLKMDANKHETDGDLQSEILSYDVDIKMEEESLQNQSSKNITNMNIQDSNIIAEQISNPQSKTEVIYIKSEPLSEEDTHVGVNTEDAHIGLKDKNILNLNEDVEGKHSLE